MSDALADELRCVLERDLLNNAGVLRALAKEQRAALAVESLEPLCALVAFTPRTGRLLPTAFLWGRDSLSCRRLLGLLDCGTAYWLSAGDPEAASAVEGWAAQIMWDAEEINHTVTPERFRPAPHPEIRKLGLGDRAALEGPRPHVARALAVPRPVAAPLTPAQGRTDEPPAANCFFGVIRGGTWCGDAFSMHSYRDVWTVADVAVAENCRRAGLGKGLVTACTAYIFAAGGRPTYQAHVENEPSRRTCAALGYAPAGRSYRFEVISP